MTDDDETPGGEQGSDDDSSGDDDSFREAETPFDQLGPVDREGDPFDALDDSEGLPDDFGDGEPNTGGPNDGEPSIADSTSGSSFEGSDPADVDSPPGGDPTDRVDEEFGVDLPPRDDDGDPFADANNTFERVEVGRVDADRVWETLTGENGVADDAEAADQSRSTVVSKHAYCEACEFFSSPPDVACQHDRAEIVEFVDMETVRLRNCPIVARRRELERDE